MLDMPIFQGFILAALMTAIVVGGLIWAMRDQDHGDQL